MLCREGEAGSIGTTDNGHKLQAWIGAIVSSGADRDRPVRNG